MSAPMPKPTFRRITPVSLLVVAFAVGLLALEGTIARAQLPSWTFDVVAQTPQGGREVAGFDYDNQNRPVVGWLELGDPALHWARKEGGAWRAARFITDLSLSGWRPDTVRTQTLTVWPDGVPHVTYQIFQIGNADFFFPYTADARLEPVRFTESWYEMSITCGWLGDVAYSLAFAPGAASPEHVTRVNCLPGGSPTGELQLNGVRFFGEYTSGFDFAIGPGGQRHILFADNHNTLRYSHGADAGIVVGTANPHHNVAVTVDADNRIHGAVGGFDTTHSAQIGYLRYLTSADGTTWTYEVIDWLDAAPALDIALDAAGQPAIAYISNGALWIARRTGGTWHRNSIRPVAIPPDRYDDQGELRLVFDRDGVPGIAFFDHALASLVIARPETTTTDTTAPVVMVPSDFTVEATSASGATVTFAASANDAVDGAVAATCTPASGSAFAIGTTLVTCTATDADGNTGSDSFDVTVSDTTPPLVNVPSDFTAEAISAAGVMVTFTASAIDAVDGAVATTCTPVSGSAFPIGTATVTCSATDAHGNPGSASFTVTVADMTPPVVTVPANITADAISSGGASVTFTASATDAIDGAVATSCMPASGSTFPVGTTRVTCAATDAAGNKASATFTVTIACPTITLSAAPLVNGTTGLPYSQAITASGNDGTAVFLVTVGSLPPGMMLSPNGILAGMPTSQGTFSFTVTATCANGCSGSRSYTLTIVCPPMTLSPATLPGGAIGAPYSQAITVSGNDDVAAFSITVGSLPAGMTLSSSFGTLSGTPTTPGTYAFTVTATCANGCTGSRSYTLTVLSPAQIIRNLIREVMGLRRGVAINLLQKALESLTAGNPITACNLLGAFINQVQAQSGRTLRVDEATRLTEAATSARAALGCR